MSRRRPFAQGHPFAWATRTDHCLRRLRGGPFLRMPEGTPRTTTMSKRPRHARLVPEFIGDAIRLHCALRGEAWR